MQENVNIGLEKSRNLSSYDVLKTLAVLLMVIDHIGYFFFPDELWLRVIGRLCVPIWFFLIGYAKTREIPQSFWIGGFILQAMSFAGGIPILALNILFSMIIVRLIIDKVMNYVLRSSENLVILSFAIFVLAIPSYFLFEYGTLGLILAMLGYLVRNKGEIFTQKRISDFSVFAILSFVAIQVLFFGFSIPQTVLLTVGVAGIISLLMNFKPMPCDRLSAALPFGMTSVFHFCGRNTLVIYVVHKIIFLAFALWLGSNEDLGLFDFKLL